MKPITTIKILVVTMNVSGVISAIDSVTKLIIVIPVQEVIMAQIHAPVTESVAMIRVPTM